MDPGVRRGRAAFLAPMALLLALSGASTVAAQGETQAVVLLHHPYDRVDPFGIPYGDGDTFSARHLAVSQEGRFDFPTFLADGVVLVSSLPDPARPYIGTLENYTDAVESRLRSGSPGTLHLQASLGDDEGNGSGNGNTDGNGPATSGNQAIAASARFEPASDLADPQGVAGLHILAAVVEDFIHYQPDARISNGVTEHRFTVRALADLGAISLAQSQNATFSFPLDPSWDVSQLKVAAWVESGASFGRFRPGEAIQSAWTPVGGPGVVQRQKAVLVEIYSATWCTPCLYGDMAAEALAVQYAGAAQAVEDEGAHYFQPPASPVLAVAAALVAGAAMAAWPGRRRSGGSAP